MKSNITQPLADRIRQGLQESLAFSRGKKNLRTIAIDNLDAEGPRTHRNQELMQLLDEPAKHPVTIPLAEVKRRIKLGRIDSQ